MLLTTQKFGKKLFKFINGNYNLLLIFLILLFIGRPYYREAAFILIWKFLLVGTIFFAVFNAKHSRVIRSFVLVLAIPSVLFSWIGAFSDTKEVVFGITISTGLFLAICASSILHDVILKAKVTLETLRGVVCVYFLFAFFFAYVYLFLESIHPGSILIRGEIHPVFPDITGFFCEMLYYSFVTLMTIGYGDIIAIHDVGQTVAVIEGILGQFYLAMFVARLVAVYSLMSHSGFKALKKPPKS